MRKIKNLKAELEALEKKNKLDLHNNAMKYNAENFRCNLRKNKTKAEDTFNKAMLKSIYAVDYEFQSIVYITKKKWIEKFYIADFLIPSIKVIIEIDGEYHFTPEQRSKDNQRTKELTKLGYRIIRLKNADILRIKDLMHIVKYINLLK